MKKLFTFALCLIIINPILSQNKKITLENIWKDYEFYPKYINGFNSMNDGNYFSRIENIDTNQEISKYEFKTGKKISVLFNSRDFDIKKISKYTFSQDEKKLLLATETESIYRYSKKSVYYVYNIHTDKLKMLHKDKLMYATFSPDGEKVAYVRANNLYIYDINKQTEVQITKDGNRNSIINGADGVIDSTIETMTSERLKKIVRHFAKGLTLVVVS